MENSFEGDFLLYDWRVTNPVRGTPKIRITLEMPEDTDQEKDLIDLRGKTVNVTLTQAVQPKKKTDVVTIDLENFSFADLKYKPRKPHNKEHLVLEGEYKKAEEKQLVSLRSVNVTVYMVTEQRELDFEEDDEEFISEEFVDVGPETVSVN